VPLRHASHHLLRFDIYDVGGDRPSVAEGVDDVAVAVAVELVLCGPLELGAEPDRTGGDTSTSPT
jgi:hypothetical protein